MKPNKNLIVFVVLAASFTFTFAGLLMCYFISTARATKAKEETTQSEITTTETEVEEIITTEKITTQEITTQITTTQITTTEEITEVEVTEEYKVVEKPEYIEPTTESDTATDGDAEVSSECLAPWIMYAVVECETHGANKECKKHVAYVILNRVNSDLFPNDIESVCYQSNQFCWRSDIEQSTIDAVNEALVTSDTTGGALFFHSMEWMSSWGGYDYIFTDDIGHHFYG